MNTNNRFDLVVSVAFAMSHLLGFIGPKPSDIITSLILQPGGTIPYLHISTLHYCIKIILTKDENCQEIVLIGTYILVLSNPPPSTGTRPTMKLIIKDS